MSEFRHRPDLAAKQRRSGQRFVNPVRDVGWRRDATPGRYQWFGGDPFAIQFYFEGFGGCCVDPEVAHLVTDDMDTRTVCETLRAELAIWERSGAMVQAVLDHLNQKAEP